MANFSKDWRPNLGGWLTMLNGAAWATVIAIVSQRGQREWSGEDFYAMCLMIVLSLPFASFLLIPSVGGGPTIESTVLASVVIGLNSFAWGYGIAALWCRMRAVGCPLLNRYHTPRHANAGNEP